MKTFPPSSNPTAETIQSQLTMLPSNQSQLLLHAGNEMELQ